MLHVRCMLTCKSGQDKKTKKHAKPRPYCNGKIITLQSEFFNLFLLCWIVSHLHYIHPISGTLHNAITARKNSLNSSLCGDWQLKQPYVPGSYLRSHYLKSRAKPTQSTAYSVAGFTSHLRVEFNNYNKPGQETILHQQPEFINTCIESQYIHVIPILNSDYYPH